MAHPIRNIHIRNFRSLESTSLSDLGGLNVLIGKNNAGKSSALDAIPLVLNHLSAGGIATEWKAARPAEQFTNKESNRALQIAIEFELRTPQSEQLCDHLAQSAPQLSKSIQQLKAHETVTVVLRFVQKGIRSYQYVESVCLGPVDASHPVLQAGADTLLFTSEQAAEELYANYEKAKVLRETVEALKKLRSGTSFPLSAYFRDRRAYPARAVVDNYVGISEWPMASRKTLTDLLESSDSEEAFTAKATVTISESLEAAESLSAAEITSPLKAYAGEVRTQPAYITELFKALGSPRILSMGERKQPIGRKEAQRLLQLKVRRGGPDQLRVVQQTVRTLLGVSLDAFQGEGGRDAAEMDVDNFLAEANGAGIRESLRMILDLELEPSDIVLLEEPEVHLHPALEFAIHGYLQEKQKTKQIFLTTHSTNFVDALTPQHIYLVSRQPSGVSTCQHLSADDAPSKLPTELGIRLSTVFMFDKIVFVEGPSDEAVLRELAPKIDINLQGAGVAFVHMGGITNFTHYAVQGTLDLLTRRRVKMWFVVDRDEREDADVKRMLDRLSGAAELFVLERRELENFLINKEAVCQLVKQKTGKEVSREQFESACEESARELRPKVAEMYLEHRSLRPIYLRGAGISGSIEERLAQAGDELRAREQSLAQMRKEVEATVTSSWSAAEAAKLVPGEILLNTICKKLGCAFDKSRGDSVRLAKLLGKDAVHSQLRDILRAVAST